MSEEIRPSAASAPETDWDAISRSVAGESDAVESAAVSQWLAAHPEDAALVALVKARADQAESRSAVSVDTERALAAVRSRITATPSLTVTRGGAVKSASATVTRRWRGPAFAAAAVLAAMVGIAQWRGGNATSPQVYATQVGQRDSVKLPDGSTVVLAPGSRLTVASGFNAGNREVTLEGAAYFDVKHDGAHPFVVHSRGAEIRDIGTAFSVNTDVNGRVAVAVTHGIVALRDTAAGSAAPVELRAGDRGVLQAGSVAVARGTVTDEDMAWTRGQLAYRDAPLAEVQADLRRWYGIELQVTDAVLAQRTLTASFRGDSAAQVVQVIALALGADVVQRGDTILLQPQGPGSTPNP
ncbi:FecR domain-containing protein [Gemmatimonas sp.]|uniref:FecR family protein n=1 Tax=Gemmatimonas sp. TaxID=1962908 RepID=UPI00286A5095|nr:FecR domain-containing protein [Gemmatimonas sp.]